jgi:hypothetical protein
VTFTVYVKPLNMRYSYDIKRRKLKASQAVLIDGGTGYQMVTDHAYLD